MLDSQRHRFDIPREVAYLNAAAWSPLPLAVQAEGQAGVARKGRPWALDPGLGAQEIARARRAAASLINAAPRDVAVIPSVSYGVATAGKFLRPAAGSRVLVIEDDHASPVLEWHARAPAGGFVVEAVARAPGDGWTQALLAAIARPGAAPVALASISSVHWSDGGIIDLAAIGAALRQVGAWLLVDATHHVGALPLDVQAIDPDVLIFPTYKWTLGPYGRAFLYVAPRHQQGEPLEQTGPARVGVNSERTPYFADLAYRADASRFDMGERDHFIGLSMAAAGMEYLAELGVAAVAARLAGLTGRLAAGLADAKVVLLPPQHRAPNLLCLEFPGGLPDHLVERLAEQRVFVAPRLGRIRISPHVYNDEADIDAFLAAFHGLMAPAARAA
jgi:selenocysteine lyase/cysteine desulfurase